MGCSVAARLKEAGFECVVLEQNSRIAEGVTSRNSGVIHAGLYYPPGSQKAISCIRGQTLLYQWCEKRYVPHKKIGKWVVGKVADIPALESIRNNSLDCGAIGIGPITNISLPGICAEIGFFSSQSGIVDPIELSKSLRAFAEEIGAIFVTNAKVLSIARLASGNFLLETTKGEISAEILVNCAGLHADKIARMDGIHDFTIYPWRGDYFRLRRAGPWTHLVYPVKQPNSPGLGVHLTLGLDGGSRLGPDAEIQTSKEDFSPPDNLEKKAKAFLESARGFLSGIRAEDLVYDTCGLRPKLRGPTDKIEKDFVLREGSPGFIHFLGIESPGLTACLALAEEVLRRLKS